jgi:hypothetical protein
MMIRRKKKRILKLILGSLSLYLLWSGYLYIRHPAPEPTQAAADLREVIGIYHVHSHYSDGRGSPEDIVRIAAGQNLAFVILTDHGNPNTASLEHEGLQSGVLLLVGSELSVNRGHLVGVGFETPAQPFSQTAELAAHQIRQARGFTVIAHPYSKVRWTWGKHEGYSGMELLSADAILRRNFYRLLPVLPLIPLKPRIPVLQLLSYPGKNLRKWDELNRRHRVYGYYSCDAHLWYGPLFSSLRLHVLLERELPADFRKARELLYAALRHGRFFNAVDAAAPAQGFRFRGKGAEGPIDMGGSTTRTPVRFEITSPPGIACEIRLLRDGGIVARTSTEELIFDADLTGTYRVEVYLKEVSPLAPDCPWILSNPIFVRKESP